MTIITTVPREQEKEDKGDDYWATYKGEGEPPKSWWAVNSKTGECTKVYRDYGAYCD